LPDTFVTPFDVSFQAMNPIRLIVLMLLCFGSLTLEAQDTLPNFSVINRGGKVIISWVNPFDSLVQISIQRSPDSARGYKTIMTVPDAKSVTNGYLDGKAPNATQFYRIYVQQPRGQYFFTLIKRPVVDNSKPTNYQIAANGFVSSRNGNMRVDSGKIKPPDPKNIFTPSVFIYTNNEGNVVIALPETKSKQYNIRFLTESGAELFEMAKISESILTLDKSNFHHAGWFRFELYENNVLKEKNKFYIPKDRQ
jgi:hypothetical protein